MKNKNKKAEAAILDLLGDDGITLDTIDDVPLKDKKKFIVESKIEEKDEFNIAASFAKKKESLAFISHERCIPWAYADRSEDEMGDIESLAISIKKYGQQEPILLRPKEHPINGIEYEIIFGNRRWRACASLNSPVKAIIKPLTDQEAAIAQKEENENREGISDYSRANFYKKILDNGIFSSTAALASNMGIGKTTLLDLLSYTRINKEVISAIHNPHKLSRRAAAKLATLSSSLDKDSIKHLITIAPDIGTGKITARNIELELNKRLYPSEKQIAQDNSYFSISTNSNGDITIVIAKQELKKVKVEELQVVLKEYFDSKQSGRPADH